jgi:hypothetical protein
MEHTSDQEETTMTNKRYAVEMHMCAIACMILMIIHGNTAQAMLSNKPQNAHEWDSDVQKHRERIISALKFPFVVFLRGNFSLTDGKESFAERSTSTGQLIRKKRLPSGKYAYLVIAAGHAVVHENAQYTLSGEPRFTIEDPTQKHQFHNTHRIAYFSQIDKKGADLLKAAWNIPFHNNKKMISADLALLYTESSSNIDVAKITQQMPEKGAHAIALGYISNKKGAFMRKLFATVDIVLKEPISRGDAFGMTRELFPGMSGGAVIDLDTKIVYGIISTRSLKRYCAQKNHATHPACRKDTSYYRSHHTFLTNKKIEGTMMFRYTQEYSWAIPAWIACALWPFLQCAK